MSFFYKISPKRVWTNIYKMSLEYVEFEEI